MILSVQMYARVQQREYCDRFARKAKLDRIANRTSYGPRTDRRFVKIACLGWGSLIWDPRNLDGQEEWHRDGPRLPVEFVRQSSNGRLTLVIFERATDVTTLWVEVSKNNLDEAVKNLGEREGIPSNNRGRHIGVWREDVEYRDGRVKYRIG